MDQLSPLNGAHQGQGHRSSISDGRGDTTFGLGAKDTGGASKPSLDVASRAVMDQAREREREPLGGVSGLQLQVLLSCPAFFISFKCVCMSVACTHFEDVCVCMSVYVCRYLSACIYSYTQNYV